MKTWHLKDAKAQFSEVVRLAQDSPQIVTKKGHEAAVILSFSEYQKISSPKQSLVDFLLSAPRVELNIERSREPLPEVILWS